MKKFSKVISLVLLVVVISSLFVPALAEGWQTRYGTKTLKPSQSYSIYVKNLQTDLKKSLHISLTADGVFGTETEKAVKVFQRQSGLTVDGLAGDATKAALWKAVN